MCNMRVKIKAVDEDVIKEYHDIFPRKWVECIVHGSLESRRSIAKAKWHDPELIVALVSSECHFMDICLGHSYLVKSLAQIELRKPGCLAQIIKQLINGKHREIVFNGDGV